MKYFDKVSKQHISLPSPLGLAGMTWLERDCNVDFSRPDFVWNNSSAAQISFPAMLCWMLQIKLAPVIHFQNMFSLNSLTVSVSGSLQLETKINCVDLLNVHFHPSWFKRSLRVLHFKRRSAPLLGSRFNAQSTLLEMRNILKSGVSPAGRQITQTRLICGTISIS